MWARAKTGGKAGFDKVYGWVDKLGAPINRMSNKVGAEAFWPTTLDKESDKAARILRSFCSECCNVRVLCDSVWYADVVTQRMASIRKSSRIRQRASSKSRKS
jgi:hypothetical protein